MTMHDEGEWRVHAVTVDARPLECAGLACRGYVVVALVSEVSLPEWSRGWT